MPFEPNTWLRRELEAGLSSLEVRNQRRSLGEMRGVNLCSSDYRGLAENATLGAAVLDAVREPPQVGGNCLGFWGNQKYAQTAVGCA